MVCRIVLLCVLAWCVHAQDYIGATGGGNTQVFYNESGEFRVFAGVGEPRGEYFISELNFNAINGKLLVGAADRLYLLDQDLALSGSPLEWPTDDNISCSNSQTDYVCRNHIRVYKRTATDESLLFVCGTQSAEEPQCRAVDISEGTLGEAFEPSEVADLGIISRHPDLPGLSEFRNEDINDTVYFSATLGPTQRFSISYQNVTIDESKSVETTELFRTVEVNKNWLRAPVTFVDYYRADYASTQPFDYQFYFVFLRENLFDVSGSSVDIVYSRVARICRNDRGSVMTTGDTRHFLSYMKARIYCERKVPSLTKYDGALNYPYNNIRSVVFNEEGRFSSEGTWVKLMYGAFSGPLIGPAGSALCVYRADRTDNSMTPNRGIFDIFREDIIRVAGETETMTEVNRLVECDPEGRSDTDAQNTVLISKDVEQLTSDPLMILDGVVVTQMVVDRLCVVSSDTTMCKNQDVLFLGTDNGKVLKVHFIAVEDEYRAVISEEISLDDPSSITDMKLQVSTGTKYLYVSSLSRVYRIPLQRCDQYKTCGDCIRSQDPYCVWDVSRNLNRGECVFAEDLIADGPDPGSVPMTYHQNIVTGELTADDICNPPQISLSNKTYCGSENRAEVLITITSSVAGLPPTYVGLYTEPITAKDEEDFINIPISAAYAVSFEEGQTTTTVSIRLIDDDVQERYTPEFTVKLTQTSLSRPVIFDIFEATVTIIDDDIQNGTVVQPPGSVSDDCDDCIERSSFDAVIAVFVIAVCILAVVVIVLALFLLRNRRKVGIGNFCSNHAQRDKDKEAGIPSYTSQFSTGSAHLLLGQRVSADGGVPDKAVTESSVDANGTKIQFQFQGPADEPKYEEPAAAKHKAREYQEKSADHTGHAQPYTVPVTHSFQASDKPGSGQKLPPLRTEVPLQPNAAYHPSKLQETSRQSLSVTAPWPITSPTETVDSGLTDPSPTGSPEDSGVPGHTPDKMAESTDM